MLLLICFLRYGCIINIISSLVEIFNVVDTPAEGVNAKEESVDKRQALKEALRQVYREIHL